MDIISYGAASKVSKEEKYTRNDILGEEVTSSFPTLEDRVNNIDKEIGDVTKQADKLIIQNAVNIMKSHAKLNTIAQSKKYQMHDMIFDDLLDLNGIDTANSKNYIHDPITGVITAGEDCVIETKTEMLNAIPEKAILTTPKLAFEQVLIDYTEYDRIASASAINSFVSEHEDKLYKYVVEYNTKNDKRFMIYVSNNPLEFYLDNGLKRKQTTTTWYINTIGERDSVSGSGIGSISSQATSFKIIPFQELIVEDNQIKINNVKFNTKEDVLIISYISRNNGDVWEEISSNNLFYFRDSISPMDKQVKLKLELPSGVELSYYALTWA